MDHNLYLQDMMKIKQTVDTYYVETIMREISKGEERVPHAEE